MNTRVLLSLLLISTAPHARAQPLAFEVVFYDLPEYLEPESIPAPTAALAALPAYPDDAGQLTIATVVYTPDPLVHGDGPYPTVMILHGSGGLWSLNDISKGPASQFKDWAEVLTDRGYLCVLPDSFNPRGIPGNFSGKRPHHDLALDDAVCSPNYERPKDVIATLAYLKSRTDVDSEHIGILAFSHGAQAGLNALMDPSIDKAPYTVDFLNAQNKTEPLAVSSPVQIPDDLPFPKVFACYYPGCGHFGYHGQASSISANRYMPDRRTTVLLFHGTHDSLLGVADPDAAPLTGTLYPVKFVESARLHAEQENITSPFMHHHIFDGADHSFDNETIESPQNWNTPDEDADEKAKRLARDETLKWFAFRLRPPSPVLEDELNDPGLKQVRWFGEDGVRYHVESTDDLAFWGNASEPGDGILSDMVYLFDPDDATRLFFRVKSAPVPVPDGEPENLGFFRPYEDFSY